MGEWTLDILFFGLNMLLFLFFPHYTNRAELPLINETLISPLSVIYRMIGIPTWKYGSVKAAQIDSSYEWK